VPPSLMGTKHDVTSYDISIFTSGHNNNNNRPLSSACLGMVSSRDQLEFSGEGTTSLSHLNVLLRQ